MPALPRGSSDDPRYRALSVRRDEAARRARASRSACRLLTAAFVVSTAVAEIGSGPALYGMEPPQERALQVLERDISEFRQIRAAMPVQ